ncbi:MAG: hypothetical protein WCJ60_03445 [bacterium]
MAKYDLTGSLETEFTFAIGDKEFKFRKPTVREMRVVAKKFAVIEKEQDTEVQTQLSEEAMRELYAFIEPIGHDAVLEDLLQDQPIGVQVAFNEMVKKELGTA